MKRKKYLCSFTLYFLLRLCVLHMCVQACTMAHVSVDNFQELVLSSIRVPGIHLGPSGIPAKWHLDSLVVFIIYSGLLLPAIYSNYRFRYKEISANLSFQGIFILYCKDTNPAVDISVVVARVLCSIWCVHARSEAGGQRLALDLFYLCTLPFETESLAEPRAH